MLTQTETLEYSGKIYCSDILFSYKWGLFANDKFYAETRILRFTITSADF